MPQIQVTAGRTLLEGYVKTPAVGLWELVWNAFDEDATTVSAKADDASWFQRPAGADAENGPVS